jgi:hypothetical protein
MRTVKLVVKNLIIISLVDKKITTEEISAIYEIVTKTYWFLQDIVTKEELKALMREYILMYQEHSLEQLKSQFDLNTKLLKNIIPTNQKLEHIKILKNLECATNLGGEQSFIQSFEDKFTQYIVDEAVLLTLSFKDYQKYIIVLMQYSFIDQISVNERAILLSELELYIKFNEEEFDSVELYEALLKEVEAHHHSHVGSRFMQNAKNLLLSFDNKQDKYFLKTLEQIKKADNKISTQEKSFDSLILTSKHEAAKEEVRAEETLRNIVFNVNSPYSIAKNEEESYLAILTGFDIPTNLVKALENMKNILHIHFEIATVDDESLYSLFKHDKLSYQQLLFIKKLLYSYKLKNKHDITNEEYKLIISKVASISYHYYKEITPQKRKQFESNYPVFEIGVSYV